MVALVTLAAWVLCALLLAAGPALAHPAADSEVEAEEDRWSFLIVPYLWLPTASGSVSISGGRLSVHTKVLAWLVEYGGAYRVFQYPSPPTDKKPIEVDVLVGAPGPVPDSESKIEFMDPIVGSRFFVPLGGAAFWGDVGITFRGDIGGFGAGSNLAWNIVSGLRWDMPWRVFSAGRVTFAGYRAYYVRASKEAGGETTSLAIQLGGPAIGLGVEF